MKVNLFIQIIVLQERQKFYIVKMKKKKLISYSKEDNIAPKKSKGQLSLATKKDKDFGGIPDIDPKKFLGCG